MIAHLLTISVAAVICTGAIFAAGLVIVTIVRAAFPRAH